jgi:hypothetical protein
VIRLHQADQIERLHTFGSIHLQWR